MYFPRVRSITIPEGNVTKITSGSTVLWQSKAYTNQIPISKDASGNYYNTVGYKNGVYINGGVEASLSGVATTGFIPCKIGDVVRFSGLSFSNKQQNHRIVFYDSSKNHIGFCQGNATYVMTNTYGAVTDSSGNYTQLTIAERAGTSTGAAYFRICCAGITAASIITVNETI